MDRREFIRLASAALLAETALQILGCGHQANFSDGRGSGKLTDKQAVITFPDTENHPVPYQHFSFVTAEEISSGESWIVSIQGNAGHDHTIRLSAEDFANLEKGIRVSKTSTDSTSDGHNHTVTFS